MAFVRSPHAHARVSRGAGARWTAAEIAGRAVPAQIVAGPPGLTVEHAPHPLLADGEVRYVGQPVAAVVAESRAVAEDAAERVEVDYEPLEPWTTRAPGETLVRWEKREGDVGGAFAAAAHVVRTDHVIPRLAAVPMEPRGAMRARRRAADRVVVVAERAPCARATRADPRPRRGLDPGDRADVGGGFGSKGTLGVETPLVALAALELGRPVKWAEDRRENFLVGAAGARAARRGRAGVRRRRPDPGAARPAARRPRRLPAAEHADPAAHDRDAAPGLLRHPGRRGVRHRRAHEQGADRALPRRRAARGELPDRDDARRRRAGARDRPGRAAPPQPRARVPVHGPRSAGRTTRATSSAASTVPWS